MPSKVILKDELLFPSKYLSWADLEGKDLTLTIVKIAKQELVMKGGAKKVKPCITFKDQAKEMVLNVTNAEAIASMYGWKAEEWVGKSVTLFPTKAQFGREMVDCIRVRESKPRPSQQDAVDAMVAEWNAKLDPDKVNADKLNGEILEAFKKIPKKAPGRTEVWGLMLAFGEKYACPFNEETKVFTPTQTTEVANGESTNTA